MQLLPIISKFNFGEVSPYLAARVDLAKHQAGCKRLENFIPLLQGPLKRRGGTRFVARTGNGDQPVVLIDFAYSETTTYVIEAGDRYLRFFYQGAPVLGDDGEIYQVQTVWRQADLFLDTGICALKWVQSGDVMYVVCPGQSPQKIARYGHTDWRVSPLLAWNADKERPNATAIALWRERLVLAAGQTVYMSQSGAFENFKLTYALPGETGQTVDRRITSVTVTCNDMLSITGNSVIGYGPTAISFSSAEASASGNLFAVTISPRKDAAGDDNKVPVAADDPMEINVYSEQMDKVEWLIPAGSLLVGTSGGEFLISETTSVDPFGPENVKVVPETSFGSTSIQALRVGAVVLFVQRAGRKVREFVYSFEGDNYVAMDVTVAAEHITQGGLTALAWQSEPIETLWCVRKDGQLLGFTYSKDQDMTAWHRHILGGGGEVSHIAVIPAAHGGRDELWVSVKREVDGETVYYLEAMEPGHEPGDDQVEAFFVDSGVTARGERLTEITGLDHLEGHEVAVLGDGGVQPRQIVTGGRVGLQYPADVVQVGLPYVSVATTSNLEANLPDGTAQSRKKRFTKATLWILDSLGGEAGHYSGEMETLEYRRGNETMDAPPRLAGGFYTVGWPHGYEDEGELTVRQTFPLPFVLAGIIPEVNVEGKN